MFNFEFYEQTAPISNFYVDATKIIKWKIIDGFMEVCGGNQLLKYFFTLLIDYMCWFISRRVSG